jgi:prepilin-type N-terminal cleavage/methylation domain-containing protein
MYMTKRAFTLMEILVAVAIFATILALASAMFVRSLQYYGESQTLTENMMQMKIFANRLSDELSSLLPPVAGKGVKEFLGSKESIQCLALAKTGVIERSYRYDAASKSVLRFEGVDDRDFSTYDAQESALRNVESLTFSYYDGTSWSETFAQGVPRAVKIVCVLAKGSFRETLEETVFIPVGS